MRSVGFLQVVVYADDGLDGGYEACEEDDKEDEDGGEELALQDGHAAEDEDEDEAEGDEHFGEGAAEFAAACHAGHGARIVVVGIGKELLVYLQHSVVAYFLQALTLQWLYAWMIAVEDDACGVVVVYLRTCLAVGEEGVHAVELAIEGYGVLAW